MGREREFLDGGLGLLVAVAAVRKGRGVPPRPAGHDFGSAAFFPLSMGFYLVASWTTSTFLFVVQSALLGIWVLWTAFCFLGLAWRHE